MAKLRISLANKCQLLFGLAVVLILTAALAVPWMRMQRLVDESQWQVARRLADAWIPLLDEFGDALYLPQQAVAEEDQRANFRVELYDRLQADEQREPMLAAAIEQFDRQRPDSDRLPAEFYRTVRADERGRVYRYFRGIYQSDLESTGVTLNPTLPLTGVADPLRAVMMIELRPRWVQQQVLLNRIYILLAGLLAGLLAIVTFWFITTRIILTPVRVLRSTAEKVAEGDLNIRSDISTGDEFEQLASAFNDMLGNLKGTQDELRKLNKQLDLKINELARSNVSLYEANRLKTDFLANVSHELRTPLHSIIGFADVLDDAFTGENEQDEKRRRYVHNIATASRSLLTMINELLDLAKIEAGRVDLHPGAMSVSDVCESLLNLIRPQADPKNLELKLNVARRIPVVETDPGKVQQIIFNFLSNAVRFTPEGGRIELGAAAVRDEQGEPTGVRIRVADTGPGIAMEHHETVFEKFRQIDDSHTKQFGGTGLGLAISRELARLIDARIELDSDVGQGATFTLVLPLKLESKTQRLMPDEPTAE